MSASTHAENRFIDQTPVRRGDGRVLGGSPAGDLHFRTEPGERGRQGNHHVVEEDGIDARKQPLFLRRNDLVATPFC